jgi:competence protein ComEC
LAAAHGAGILFADAGWLPHEPALWLAMHALFAGLLPLPRAHRLALAAVVSFGAGVVAMGLAFAEPSAMGEGVVRCRLERAGPMLTLAGCVGADDDAAPGRLALRRPEDVAALGAVASGARLRLALRWAPAALPTNPGARDRRRAGRRSGVAAEARLVHPALVRQVGSASPAATVLRDVRQRAASRLDALGEGGALLAALSLAERAAIPAWRRDALARAGLAHLLAVSGLHLALVAGGALWLGGRMLRRSAWLASRLDVRRLALLPALLAALGYAALTGVPVSLRRALVFAAVVALGWVVARPARATSILAAAALAVLVNDPASCFAPGAWLSFVAAGALMLARRAAPPAGPAPWRAAVATLRASATAALATAPLVAVGFGLAAPFGWVANLIAVPWTGFVLLPAALLAAGVAMLPAHAVGDVLLSVLAAIAAGSLHVATEAFAWLPVWTTAAPGPLALGLAAVGIAFGLAVPWTAARVATASAVAFVLLIPAAPGGRLEPPRVVFIDVGQGDAVLVQGQRGTLLVDAGPARPGGFDAGRSIVAPALRALGVRRIDVVVASHADADHRGGLPAILERHPVGEVWIPAGTGADEGWAELLRVARAHGIRVRERGAESGVAMIGDLDVEPLWPPRRAAALSRNDRSLVLAVGHGRRRVLLTGDVERRAEEALVASRATLRADVLKLPHHGSRTSSSDGFLAAVAPRLVVVSAPERSRFAMPHPEVRARLDARGLPLCWTGFHGAVEIELRSLAVAAPFADREPPPCDSAQPLAFR